jgi:murein DD-endopeptidase MepM/ murein hydrolase activator NlpD
MSLRHPRQLVCSGRSYSGSALALGVALCTALLSGAAPASAQATPTKESDVTGTWRGTVGAGAGQLHLLLTITKLSNGEYSGQLNSVDQGATLPMDAVTLEGRKLRFEVKPIGGLYEGTLNEARSEITGTWTQANVPAQALSFERDSSASSAQQGKGASEAKPGPTTRPFIVPLDLVVPAPPRAFQADGKTHLVYELHLVNMGQWDCLLTRMEVLSADAAARSLDSAAGAKLEGMMARPGVTAGEKARLVPGSEGIMYMWVSFEHPNQVPAAIRHRIHVKIGEYPEELDLDTLPVAVSTATATISSPLRGDHWLAGNGPSNSSGHRRALIPIDGRAAIAQRFAIDWVKLGNDGHTYHDDKLDNKNYYAYGVDALAVADGVVTEVKDGIPQNIPGENSRAVPITLETVGGNHVIVDIGNGNYAFYAHLQPGSLRVKLGDKVRRGQVVGLVGNSGNSTEPHLHFHISNGNSPLGSEGLPYLLPAFEVEGSGWTWKPSSTDSAPVKHTQEIPLENEVVRFTAQP